jgi:hypothetical protein
MGMPVLRVGLLQGYGRAGNGQAGLGFSFSFAFCDGSTTIGQGYLPTWLGCTGYGIRDLGWGLYNIIVAEQRRLEYRHY